MDTRLLGELLRLDVDTEDLVTGIADVLDRLARLPDGGEHTELGRITIMLETVLTAHSAVELVGRRGEPAAPQTHHVVEVRDTADLPADAVVKVIERGIRYRGNLLRPASVVVSSGKGTQS